MGEQECKHFNFAAETRVNRFEDNIGAFSVDLTIRCTDCGKPLEFVGMPLGCSFYGPTTSLDGLTATLPATIQGQKMPKGLPGMVGRIVIPSETEQ